MKNINEDELNLSLMLEIAKFQKSAIAVFMPSIRKSGLTLPQANILMRLYHEKRPLSVNELIDLTISSSGNTDVVINNLIKSGLILKKQDLKDKRKRLIELTEAGLIKAAAEYQEHQVILNKVLSPFSREQKESLFSEFIKLSESVEENFQNR